MMMPGGDPPVAPAFPVPAYNPFDCPCGRKAKHFKNGKDYVCGRCADLENRIKANELRQRATFREGALKWDSVIYGQRNIDLGLSPWVDDFGNLIIVHAHGDYHLPVARRYTPLPFVTGVSFSRA